eukprot:2629083-Alexandrium_andersonii.AAC.1
MKKTNSPDATEIGHNCHLAAVYRQNPANRPRTARTEQRPDATALWLHLAAGALRTGRAQAANSMDTCLLYTSDAADDM